MPAHRDVHHGYRWRASNIFIVTCITIALSTETFLYSFIVPILQVMLRDRLGIDDSKAQSTTSTVLFSHAFACAISAPITGQISDKMSSRKIPLLITLGAELLGTVLCAAATSLPILIMGRVIQAIGGNATWIIGLATIADTVGADNTSRTLATISMFYMSGMLIGPITSGTLLRFVGYWPTWGTAIAVLVIDMVMRVVMIEKPVENKKDKGVKRKNSITDEDSLLHGDLESTTSQIDHISSVDETTGLLTSSPKSHDSPSGSLRDPDVPSETGVRKHTVSQPSFYRVLLTNPRALTGMACHLTAGLVLTSLDTTLPLHVTREFGWDTSRVSLMFLLVQTPFLILGPLTGWLKDRIGSRVPTGIGYVSSGVMMWILGIPGSGLFSFAGAGDSGKLLYAASLLGLGIARSLTTGAGILEMTTVIRDLQADNPEIFGPKGGYSRGYSLTNMSWTAGMLIGPVLSGWLTETAGYYYMNLTFGKSNNLTFY
ncbi:putative MFS transporter [Talaromyces proteolyticus]|uniref:MFS transporter n=1 Tax=Talaromyces proteolyticus TaxID=1131652 RepID=A0AAD4PY09_9EURO|nr:putative MFS transporter [Talaromyces proteolyticus]KAH8693551.1 putative MFS transporter [Talaromyces proteolyticus]